jgi:hypothetical protein
MKTTRQETRQVIVDVVETTCDFCRLSSGLEFVRVQGEGRLQSFTRDLCSECTGILATIINMGKDQVVPLLPPTSP